MGLLDRTAGVVDAFQCSTICDAQDSCTAFTLWGTTSLNHWEECWTFSACEHEQPCDECTTGRKTGDCSSTTSPATTTGTATATDTTPAIDTTTATDTTPAID